MEADANPDEGPMSTAATLLARKQQIVDRLQEDPGPNERAELERLLQEIDSALNDLENAGLSTAKNERQWS
jgi:hypothetical protein